MAETLEKVGKNRKTMPHNDQPSSAMVSTESYSALQKVLENEQRITRDLVEILRKVRKLNLHLNSPLSEGFAVGQEVKRKLEEIDK